MTDWSRKTVAVHLTRGQLCEVSCALEYYVPLDGNDAKVAKRAHAKIDSALELINRGTTDSQPADLTTENGDNASVSAGLDTDSQASDFEKGENDA